MKDEWVFAGDSQFHLEIYTGLAHPGYFGIKVGGEGDRIDRHVGWTSALRFARVERDILQVQPCLKGFRLLSFALPQLYCKVHGITPP